MISEDEGERRKKYVSVLLSFMFMCVLAIGFFVVLFKRSEVKAALRALRDRRERQKRGRGRSQLKMF